MNDMNQFQRSYGFSDVAICQKKNICASRLDANISSEIIRGVKVEVPLIAANMSTVINADFYIQTHKLGAFAVLHRADTEENIVASVLKVKKECEWVAASIGVGEKQFEFAKTLIQNGANIIVVDIAHGYCDPVIDMGVAIKKFSKDVKVVLGNTTNLDMLYEVSFKSAADAVKVGIGQGSACETKNSAGSTEGQFSAVYKFKQVSRELGIPIISDGSISEPADFSKAIAAGANSVMAGKIFARCPESAAEVEFVNDVPKKVYAGMASRHVQDQWRGGLKKGTCPEGTVRYLDLGESLEKLLERYSGALRSAVCYSGGRNIWTMQEEVKFVVVK